MKSSLSFAKVWFIVSFAGLAFLYGTAVGKWEWFPYSYVNQAADQARSVYRSIRVTTDNPSRYTMKRIYDRSGVRIVQPDKVQPGMTLVLGTWERKGNSGNLDPGAKLIDREGKTVHKWFPEQTELFQTDSRDLRTVEFMGSHLLPNGDLLLNAHGVGTVRLNACGKVVWRLKEGGHHSIDRAEDGSFWIAGRSLDRRTSTPNYPNGLPGVKSPLLMDLILNVSEDGKLIDKINLLDILYDNDLEHYIIKGQGPLVKKIKNDPVHLNDIEPLPSSMADEYPLFESGDLLVSLRYPDLVFVFDPQSKKVKWYSSRHFTRQHDPDFIGGGWIGVFDNRRDLTERGEMLGGTRIVEIQPHTDSVRIPFPTQLSAPHYTESQGNWQKLANGNMLLVEAHPGRIVEVDSKGKTVWEWIQEPYSESKIPLVEEASRHDLKPSNVASWPCSSVDSVSTSKQSR